MNHELKMEEDARMLAEDHEMQDDDPDQTLRKDGDNEDGHQQATWKVLTVEGSIETEAPREKKCKKRSEIWNHFVKTLSNDGKRLARCNYCDQILSFSGGSISNLLRHLRKKHPGLLSTGLANPKVLSKVTFEKDAQEPIILKVAEYSDINKNSSFSRFSTEVEGSQKHDGDLFVSPSQILQQAPSSTIFAHFISSELSRFQTEFYKNKCKRMILRALLSCQEEEEDKGHTMPDHPDTPKL